eukprot:scaffold195371_cov41-Prasinocladus_malaysianus.AAC.1
MGPLQATPLTGITIRNGANLQKGSAHHGSRKDGQTALRDYNWLSFIGSLIDTTMLGIFYHSLRHMFSRTVLLDGMNSASRSN